MASVGAMPIKCHEPTVMALARSDIPGTQGRGCLKNGTQKSHLDLYPLPFLRIQPRSRAGVNLEGWNCLETPPVVTRPGAPQGFASLTFCGNPAE
jgi:hypothetical protein